jgi:hypothetical protein
VDSVDESDEQVDTTATLAWLLSTIHHDPVPHLRLVVTTRSGMTARRFPTDHHLDLRQIRSRGSDDVVLAGNLVRPGERYEAARPWACA